MQFPLGSLLKDADTCETSLDREAMLTRNIQLVRESQARRANVDKTDMG